HNIMKKFILFAALALTAAGCGAGEGRDHSTGFKIAPGSVSEFTIKTKSYNVTYSGPKTGDYAVVFLGNIGGESYVGVALSSDPKSATSFNLKMYFRADSIPGSYTLNPVTLSDLITVRNEGGTTYSDRTAWTGTLTLNFTDKGDGTYEITSIGNPSIDGNNLTITTITALKVP
ncbi:MAG: hypothetical protein QM472_13060, partial [Spirochaetota bacterium]|nr:hypothetical protein [Spirochaetota bacterium]